MAPHATGDVPAVSVVMTVHRTPPALLTAAIRSIREQTLDDLELVVVIDQELDVPDEFDAVVAASDDDRRIKVLRPGRIGRGAALNLGVDEATSDLVAIQDADDESHPERLERQVLVLARRGDIGLLGTAVRRSADLEAHAAWPLDPPSSPRPIGDRILITNPLVHTSVVVRRAVLEKVGGYAVSRRWQLDYDLYLRLRQAGAQLSALAEPLALKRVHADQYFENSGHDFERLWSAYQLQHAYTRRENPARRIGYGALALGRLVSRGARQSVRVRRRGSPSR